jgi:hypothetical protein
MDSPRNSSEGLVINEFLIEADPKRDRRHPRFQAATTTYTVNAHPEVFQTDRFDRSTQFLESGYVGEVAVLPSAWSGPNSETTVETAAVQTLPDPKLAIEKLAAESKGSKDASSLNTMHPEDKEKTDAKRYDDGDKRTSSRHK